MTKPLHSNTGLPETGWIRLPEAGLYWVRHRYNNGCTEPVFCIVTGDAHNPSWAYTPNLSQDHQSFTNYFVDELDTAEFLPYTENMATVVAGPWQRIPHRFKICAKPEE